MLDNCFNYFCLVALLDDITPYYRVPRDLYIFYTHKSRYRVLRSHTLCIVRIWRSHYIPMSKVDIRVNQITQLMIVILLGEFGDGKMWVKSYQSINTYYVPFKLSLIGINEVFRLLILVVFYHPTNILRHLVFLQFLVILHLSGFNYS